MKQVIVMRTDLNMRKGKMIAQGAHAALGCLVGEDISVERLVSRDGLLLMPQAVNDWLRSGMKKICVCADSEEELMAIHKRAKDSGLPSFLVTDAGHTEFKEPTNTCIAVGPADDAAIDAVTGDLRLL